VWGKRKAVGRKHSMRFEPINFEIEVGQEEAVRWEGEPTLREGGGVVGERGSLLREKDACYSPR
jgi:hypothetical protein